MRGRGVEFGDLTRPEDPVVLAEDEAQVPGQDVDPFVAVAAMFVAALSSIGLI